MSLAQGEPFVLTYRLGIIGLAQWVDMHEASFTILFHSLQLDKVCPDTPLPRSLPGRQLHLETSLSPSWLSQAGPHMCNFTLACHYLQLCHWLLWNQKRRPTQFFSLSRIDGFFLKTWAPSSPQGRCLTGQLAGLHVCRKAQRTVRTSLQHGAGERAQCRAVGPVPTQQHLATCACHTRCSLASHLPNLIETSAPLISS